MIACHVIFELVRMTNQLVKFIHLGIFVERGIQYILLNFVPGDVLAKRTHFTSPVIWDPQMDCDLRDADSNGVDDGASDPLTGNDLSPAEKITNMIGALLAEGERGAGSLDLLISNIPADFLLADIVIETLKYLPINPMS